MEISNSTLQINPNWLDLPRDVTLTILKKLDASVILSSVQYVCRLWYVLCKEPSIWRTIRINGSYTLLRSAVDRSAGGLIDLDIEHICTPELFSYALSQSSKLKRLRLALCYGISVMDVKESLENLSSLEELELTLCYFQGDKVIPIISSCPFLTTFKFHARRSAYWYLGCDDDALAIAAGMPKLRHLQLIGNNMTNVGLTAILDGCPLLQSLDLRGCSLLDLTGNLGKRLLENIRDLRRPCDSTEDYKYQYETSDDDDNDVPEVDLISEGDYDIVYDNNEFDYGVVYYC
ncbi:putative F-box/LRR-repeat protein 23 [Silene latifolia]|uniref:putative F-box/LRR-repeat protein 23 n=1 Tax=Silene latifolia TaxID=37657 RepID=UPI003D777CEE